MKKTILVLCVVALIMQAFTIYNFAQGVETMNAGNAIGRRIILDGKMSDGEGWEAVDSYKLDTYFNRTPSDTLHSATPAEMQAEVKFATDGDFLYILYRSNMQGFASYPHLTVYVDFPSSAEFGMNMTMNGRRDDYTTALGTVPAEARAQVIVDAAASITAVEAKIPIPEQDRAALRQGSLEMKIGVIEKFVGWANASKGEIATTAGMTFADGFDYNADCKLVLPKIFDLKEPQTKGSFVDMTYVTSANESRAYKIFMPADYNATKLYSLIYAEGDVNGITLDKSNIPSDCVVVKLNSGVMSENEHAEFLYILTHGFSIDEKFVYYVGSAQRAELIKYSFTAVLDGVGSHGSERDALMWLCEQVPTPYFAELEGITMHAIGDSLFYGSGIGKENSWPSLLAEKYHMTHENYGRGGNTIAMFKEYGGNEYDEPMVTRYQKMVDDDAQIILIEGGSNDSNKSIKIGSNDSKDINEFKGALNVMLDGLLEKYPNALIVCVSCYNTGTRPIYAKAMCDVVKNRNDIRITSINASDYNVSGINMGSQDFRNEYCINSEDVSHLNVKGMKMALPRFEKLIGEAYVNYLNYDPNAPTKDEAEDTFSEDDVADIGDIKQDTTAEDTETEKKGGCGSSISGSLVLPLSAVAVAAAAKKKKKKEK